MRRRDIIFRTVYVFTDLSREDRCNVVVQDLMRFFGNPAMLQFVDYQEKVVWKW